MEVPVVSLKSTEITQDPMSYANGKTCDWKDTTEIKWFNDSDNKLESLSAASSLSEFNEVDLPEDVPDGPQFSNLSTHIDSMVASLTDAGSCTKLRPPSVNNNYPGKPPILHTEIADPNRLLLTAASHPLGVDVVDVLEKHKVTINSEPENIESEYKKMLSFSQDETEAFSDIASNPSDELESEEPLPLPMLDIVKPFAFFPAPDTYEVKSDQWPWPTGTADALHRNDDATIEEEKGNAVGDVDDPDPVKVANLEEDESDEDFGAFEGCTAPISEDKPVLESPVGSKERRDEQYGILSRLLQHLEPALARAFEIPTLTLLNTWLNETRTDVVCASSYSSFGTEELPPQQQLQDSSSCMTSFSTKCGGTTFWGQLFNRNRVHEMRQQWNKSVLYDSYLRSVNVDIRSAMPAFASQLRLLEPTRPGTSNNNNSNWQAKNQPSLTTDSTGFSASPTALSTAPSNLVTTPSSEAFPAPEFDWSSSGLTNPLGVHTGTEQLDLDFFEVQSEARGKKPPSKDAKLSELELELLATIPQPPTVSNPPVVQPILNTTQGQTPAPPTAIPPKASALSSTVRAVVSKLPNLRYMRARNLIFPVPKTEPN